MAFPSGVITRQVVVDQIHDLIGNSLTGQVQVESSLSLRWKATDELVLATPETIFLANGAGSITLPTIQQGFTAG